MWAFMKLNEDVSILSERTVGVSFVLEKDNYAYLDDVRVAIATEQWRSERERDIDREMESERDRNREMETKVREIETEKWRSGRKRARSVRVRQRAKKWRSEIRARQRINGESVRGNGESNERDTGEEKGEEEEGEKFSDKTINSRLPIEKNKTNNHFQRI
ncbi:hypothetical protein DPMN_178913 [Dreissena polymorpha]|uniref:Uncharacterized protein n=1 Tax=Dreissena polymorpha TaxID=45954 RepID=A0A9D4ED12_DREPO|nr:hypothetical protein DPMN_178913 [Dreissena polymorpha]